MEMEKTVMELVGGLKWEILFMLFQCMLVGYIILTIKAFIVNEFAYRKFRNSLFISVGTKVKILLGDTIADGKIVGANRSAIRIEIDGATVYMPTKLFPQKEWVVLK